MVVEFDRRRQRLIVSDNGGQVILTLEGPTPADIEFWQGAAARLRAAKSRAVR